MGNASLSPGTLAGASTISPRPSGQAASVHGGEPRKRTALPAFGRLESRRSQHRGRARDRSALLSRRAAPRNAHPIRDPAFRLVELPEESEHSSQVAAPDFRVRASVSASRQGKRFGPDHPAAQEATVGRLPKVPSRQQRVQVWLQLRPANRPAGRHAAGAPVTRPTDSVGWDSGSSASGKPPGAPLHRSRCGGRDP